MGLILSHFYICREIHIPSYLFYTSYYRNHIISSCVYGFQDFINYAIYRDSSKISEKTAWKFDKSWWYFQKHRTIVHQEQCHHCDPNRKSSIAIVIKVYIQYIQHRYMGINMHGYHDHMQISFGALSMRTTTSVRTRVRTYIAYCWGHIGGYSAPCRVYACACIQAAYIRS